MRSSRVEEARGKGDQPTPSLIPLMPRPLPVDPLYPLLSPGLHDSLFLALTSRRLE